MSGSREFGCMPATKITPCGHCPPRRHKARGMCCRCYDRFLKANGGGGSHTWRGKPHDVPVAQLPRGNRVELWLWEQEYWDINEDRRSASVGKFYIKHARQVWAVEFGDSGITGAFGPMDSGAEWLRLRDSDPIIRKAAVIGVMEERRGEFKRVAA